MATDKQKQKIVDAFIAVVSERPWHEVSLAVIAARAEVPLSTLRSAFASRLDILAAFIERIDTAVLAGLDPDLAEAPPKDRLFDLLMRRFDLLAPYKGAVGALREAARRDPGLALSLAGFALRSQRWTLEAAGIESTSPAGRLKAKGLAYVYAKALKVWLDEDDEAHGRTMAALDKELERGGEALKRAEKACDTACRTLRPFAAFIERSRAHRPGRQSSAPSGEAPEAA